jgi:hypothetical protein
MFSLKKVKDEFGTYAFNPTHVSAISPVDDNPNWSQVVLLHGTVVQVALPTEQILTQLEEQGVR